MMENLFDIINGKMFSVFTSKDKRTNYDLLVTIYDIFTKQERRPNIDRDELIENLVAYIRGRNIEFIDDENGESINNKPAKEKIAIKIKQFKKCGWLEEDFGQGFTTLYSLSSQAMTLLETFKSMINSFNRPLEYTGYFYIIFHTINNFDIGKAKALLEQIMKNTHELFNSLQGLNSNIKQFIEGLLKKDNSTPQEILDMLLYKYQDQVMLTVFNNLKTRDNPNWYIDGIIGKAKELKNKRLDEIIQSYIASSNDKNITSDKYNALHRKIEEDLDELISRFEEVDLFISIIDGKNTAFHTTALSKLNFLLNTKKDLDGLLVNALKAVKEFSDEMDFSDYIKIFNTRELDDKSLYTYTFNKEKVTFVENDIPELPREEIDLEFKKLMEEDEYTKDSINQFILNMLGSKGVIHSSELIIKDFEILFKLMMAQVYSNYDDIGYQIELKEDTSIINGFQLQSFEIRRRSEA